MLVADILPILVVLGSMTKKPPLPAQRLARFMKDAGLSQVRLGKLAECSGQQIGKLLNGDRTLDYEWAEKLAPHLGVNPGDFFQIPDNDTPDQGAYDPQAKVIVEGDLRMPKNDEEGELLEIFRQLDSVHKGRLIEIANDFLALRWPARPFAHRRA